MRFFSQSARALDKARRISFLKEEKRISLKRKCELLNVNRSGLYYEKQMVLDLDDGIAEEIQNIYLKYPFYGYRKIHATLLREGYIINRKKVQRLMQENKLRAICPKRRTSVRDKSHAVYPYLLKNMEIVQPNQAWQVDITYIKIKGGFIYLICFVDIYSRKVMGSHLSTLLDTDACLIALKNALKKAMPEIINSDQGCQFTSELWCEMLKNLGIKISMDGKGRWADNIYIERLWRTIKYELFYLYRFETVHEARIAVMQYIEFYNTERPHQTLGYRVPEEVYNQYLNKRIMIDEIEQGLPFAEVTNNFQIFAHFLS
jgi:putative transposase